MTSVVQPDAPELPADADALRALVLAMMAEREALTAGRDTLQAQNERLAHLLLKLRRLQFGRKAERLPDEQLQLGLEDLEQAIAQEEAQAEKRDPALREARTAKRRARRGALPAHLPRVEVTLRRRTSPARAAGRRGRRSARTSPSGSTSSPPSSG